MCRRTIVCGNALTMRAMRFAACLEAVVSLRGLSCAHDKPAVATRLPLKLSDDIKTDCVKIHRAREDVRVDE